MFESRAEADPLEQRTRLLPCFTDRCTAHEQRQCDVFECGKLGQQVVELIDEAEGLIAQRAARGVGQLIEPSPGDGHLATRRQVESAEQLQQRRLAGTGCTDDGDPLARRHHEIDPAQHLEPRVTLPKDFRQAARCEHGTGTRRGPGERTGGRSLRGSVC
jgi:hypothetical protein